MKTLISRCCLLLSVFLFASSLSTHGAIVLSITEDGSDILVTTSGTADVTQLGPTIQNTSNSPYFGFGAFAEYAAFSGSGQDSWDPALGFNIVNGGLPTSGTLYYFQGEVLLESGNGDVGFNSTGLLWLPLNYVSGTEVNQVIRVSDSSFSEMGVSVGDFASMSWTAAGGGTDSVTMIVGSPVIPEPSRALLSLVGIAAIGLRRRRN